MQIISIKHNALAENRPYWFDLPEVLGDIWDDVIEVKDAAVDIIKWIKSDAEDNKKALSYTGKSLVSAYCI